MVAVSMPDLIRDWSRVQVGNLASEMALTSWSMRPTSMGGSSFTRISGTSATALRAFMLPARAMRAAALGVAAWKALMLPARAVRVAALGVAARKAFALAARAVRVAAL